MDAETRPISNRHARRAVAAIARHLDDPRAAPPAIADRIIREAECDHITGLSRSTRWRLERKGQFPKRRQLSPGCSGWLASEIAAWISAR